MQTPQILHEWEQVVQTIHHPTAEVTIAIVGKYSNLEIL